jgi:CubicO group peptidase (beta-lactamase class C family)
MIPQCDRRGSGRRGYPMVLRVLLLAISLLASAIGAELPRAAPAEVGLSQERLDRITQALESSVAQGHIAGAIGVVARKGKIAYWQNVGMADREGDRAMADDAIFRIFSMTKPIVSVALMILYEEGKFSLKDEVKQHIPELGGLKVWVAGKEVAPDREMTVQDLMRHTSGMTYGLFGDSRVDEMYNEAEVLSGNKTVAEFVEKLSKLPLKHQPGTRWEYSVSVDVQGRLIEVLSGMDLATYMSERVFKPLDMRDTAFRMTEQKSDRFAQVYQKTKDAEGIEPANDARASRYYEETQWYSGGGGLVSTTRDYLRFCQMLLNGGILDGTRILSRKTVALMTIDHTGSISNASSVLAAGYGFGLNFAVHVDPAKSGLNGSVGEYNWGGLAGTSFWIDPAEDLIGVYMIQMMPPRFANGAGQFKRLVYQSIAD